MKTNNNPTIGEYAKDKKFSKRECQECGKILKYYNTKRCRTCWKLFTPCFHKKLIGKNNPKWKGDEVSYSGLHKWVVRHKPKGVCVLCGSDKNIQAANISGEYKRDINDYRWLCSACHVRVDGTINNLNTKKEVNPWQH